MCGVGTARLNCAGLTSVVPFTVKPSREPGWLEGSLDGKTGLIPANYVEYLNLN